ncbi:MAG: endonuclease NucS domain-containing protein [Candidatus Aenigmatarchaeota archaeon]
MLEDEQIGYSLREFKESETYLKGSEQRKKAHEFNSKWINPETIKNMEDEELKKKFLEYYSGGEGRQSFNKVYRDRIVRDISQFKNMLLYLLDEKIPIEQRFKEVVEGEYHIEGVGKALASAFLMDLDIDKYCIWNNRTEMGLNVLGWKVYESKDDIGTKYVKVLEALRKIRDDIAPELKLTFDDVDFFLQFISAEEEGIKLVSEITKGMEISVPSSSEQLVHRIIERNFEEIIGKRMGLELYQDDPENSGSEYPTSVGRIDFLAKDKESGELVVIELKSGKATDDALAQVLRYMGWVKENIAGNKNVRGLILAEEVDDRLKYAIKNVENVKIFTYKVSLQISEYIS